MKLIHKFIFFLTIFLFFSPSDLSAHEPNRSYIFLSVYQDSISGYYEMKIPEFNKVFNLDIKEGMTTEDVKEHLPKLNNYVLEHIKMSSSEGEHPLLIKETELISEGNLLGYFQIYFKLQNVTTIPDELKIKYDGVFEVEPTHRGMQIVAYNWKAGILDNEKRVSLIFTPNNTEQSLDLTNASIFTGFMAMIGSGIHHIWIGLDHILFLLALILPGVVRRQRKEDTIVTGKGIMAFSNAAGIWKPVERFKPALIYVVTIITFFTIAHSITLSLAALGIVSLDSRLIESIIAFSIALAAYHNIRPLFKKDWLIAFGFGLFHGFGFASVLGEVGVSGEFMVPSLLGFNIGVEIGQIAIIAVIFPILYFIRNLKIYPKLLTYGSLILILIAMYWFVERAFNLDMQMGRIVFDLIGYNN